LKIGLEPRGQWGQWEVNQILSEKELTAFNKIMNNTKQYRIS
jgi:hypothetical protein